MLENGFLIMNVQDGGLKILIMRHLVVVSLVVVVVVQAEEVVLILGQAHHL